MNETLPISTLTVDKALNGDKILKDQENIKLLMQFQSMLLKDLLFLSLIHMTLIPPDHYYLFV